LAGEQGDDSQEEAVIRERARQAVRAGTLPNRRPDHTWGGYGAGAVCTICATPVKHDELEFEIEFARSDDPPGVDSYHLHVHCFEAWQLERNSDGPSHANPSR
jgi:hypothetical protein